MAAGGIVIAYRYYLVDPHRSATLAARYPALYRALFHKYWVDELYDTAVVRPAVSSARTLSESFDARIVDGSVNGIAALANRAGSVLRRMQTGEVPAYILSILVGAVVILGYLAFSG
jgi:NADH-quinone oxidoreductase subunit L